MAISNNQENKLEFEIDIVKLRTSFKRVKIGSIKEKA